MFGTKGQTNKRTRFTEPLCHKSNGPLLLHGMIVLVDGKRCCLLLYIRVGMMNTLHDNDSMISYMTSKSIRV